MAVRITLKRSSIPNKRPNADILDPGELALNTNALTPGLFFEADNNTVIKVGPTSVGLEPPTLAPSLGETFFDTVTRELQVGGLDPITLSQTWLNIASPYLGGTNGYVVFVAPEFPSSSDDISNNGQSAPFKTLNRAVIEVAKQSIVVQNESDAGKNNRFVIYVAPGICPVYNGPGLPLPVDNNPDNIEEFRVSFEGSNKSDPNVLALQQFNSISGGLLLPRGTSILGMDLRKVELRPSYVPTYKNPTTNAGVNQPTTAVIKWSGNSYINELSFRDKRSTVNINGFLVGPAGEGVFVSSRAHCFGLNDRVYFQFAPGTNQTPIGTNVTTGVLSGFYYTYPLGANTFYLSYTPITATEANYVERADLPASPQGLGYLATCVWEPYSHNRLRCLFAATKVELDEFYTKVQLAYPLYFQGKANQAEVVNPGETEIVGPVPGSIPLSVLSNTTENASPYVQNVSVRSNYGLCGLEHDGDLITGFKSALAGSFCVVSLQNDPAAYEVYTTIQDPQGSRKTNWFTLQYATWASLSPAVRPENPGLVTVEQQIELLNNTEATNIRYYFTTQTAENGDSFGLADLQNDFRHFGVRAQNRAYIQVDTGWAIGCAVGAWAYNGGQVTCNSSSTNFGLNALRAEGFYGIGSNSQAQIVPPADSNFLFQGIRMPDKILPRDTINFKTVELGGGVLSVTNDGAVQTITLGPGFQPINILPYALDPETAIYITSSGNTVFRAFFTNDGLATTVVKGDGTTELRVRSIDSTIPLGSAETNPDIRNWTSPFIKRWLDPRNIGESSYALILGNSNPGHRTPSLGSIVRLNQSSSTSPQLLRSGVQFDPGPNGGWGRVFQTAYVESAVSGDSPQFNEVILNRNTENSYYVALQLCDGARPWLQETDNAHGDYTTYQNRNWYAACNDDWTQVYYNNTEIPSTKVKLVPPDLNSPWATSFSSELQLPVNKTYQGAYAPDPQKDLYPDGTYFRGDVLSFDNYGFDLILNIDNGTPNFGLLRHTVPTAVVKTLTVVLKPGETTITVDDVVDIPNPRSNFVVMALNSINRVEYVQVIGVDSVNNVLTVIRGVYNTPTTQNWDVDTPLTLQAPAQEVLTTAYDFDWSPSKSAAIRFLQVMGYSDASITSLLKPLSRSARNVNIGNISVEPERNGGYAVATGPWPLEFASPSEIDALSHSFHSVGRLNYSRGLPQYQRNELNVKQYYDYLATELWAGLVRLTGADENGNLPTNGVFTEAETGRPYGTYTSDITNSTRVDPGPGEGGGGGGGGVNAVYTGPGLVGGPIFAEGTISLLPPTGGAIGGVKQGTNITIDPDGTINASGGGGSGSVSSITFNNGLTGGTVTTTGTVGVNVGVGLKIDTNGTLAVKPGTAGEIGGVKAGTAISISTEGAVSVLPPTGPVIGGVKAGTGVTIAADGTISVSSAPSSGIVLIDNLSSSFNGVLSSFPLTVGGRVYTPGSSASVLITVGNVPQPSPSSYSVTGSTITFTTPPPAGADFYGVGLNGTLQSLPQAGYSVVLLDDISSLFNGTTVQFTLKVSGTPYSPTASYYAYISIGGCVQSTPSAYTVTGSTITFTAAPPAGATFYGIAFG